MEAQLLVPGAGHHHVLQPGRHSLVPELLGLGLTDKYLGYIIPAIVAPYNFILVKTYIESIPASLAESATNPDSNGECCHYST